MEYMEIHIKHLQFVIANFSSGFASRVAVRFTFIFRCWNYHNVVGVQQVCLGVETEELRSFKAFSTKTAELNAAEKKQINIFFTLFFPLHL